jgi:hypothetical protein
MPFLPTGVLVAQQLQAARVVAAELAVHGGEAVN